RRRSSAPAHPWATRRAPASRHSSDGTTRQMCCTGIRTSHPATSRSLRSQEALRRRSSWSSDSCGPHGDARVVEHETELVVHEYGPEVEGWRDIVVARMLAVVRQPRVALLEPLDAEVSRAHVHSWSIGSLTHFEPESMHGECVRARGRFEIHVEAAGELGHRLTVDEPPAGSVALEAKVVLSERRPTDDVSRACGPRGIEREGVADRP